MRALEFNFEVPLIATATRANHISKPLDLPEHFILKYASIARQWQTLDLGPEDLSHHFNGRSQNIGVLLGDPSGWLVDVD